MRWAGWFVCFATRAEATKFDRSGSAVVSFSFELEPGTNHIVFGARGHSERDSTASLSVRAWSAVARCGEDSLPITLVPLGGLLPYGGDAFFGSRSDRRAWVPAFRIEGLPPTQCTLDLEIHALAGFEVVDRSNDPLGVELELLAVGGVAP